MLLLWWLGAAYAAECAGQPIDAVATFVAKGEATTAADHYAVAPCLEALNLPHVAEREWIDGIRLDTERTGTAAALESLAVIADETGDDQGLIDTAARVPEALRSPKIVAILDYAAGRDLARGGSRNEAIERLKKVPDGLPQSVAAKYRLGRLEWERGQTENAIVAFDEARKSTFKSSDPFITILTSRWRDLAALGLGYLEAETGDVKAAKAALAGVNASGPIGPLAVEARGWLGVTAGGKSRKEATKLGARQPVPFLPDLPLLFARTYVADSNPKAALEAVSGFEAQWGPIRDQLDAFLVKVQPKPEDAWTTFRTDLDESLRRDVLLNGTVLQYSNAVGLLAVERQSISDAWSPEVREYLEHELAEARADVHPRAGRVLVRALESRQERLYTLSAQTKRLKDEALPSLIAGASVDAEATRPIDKPVSFLATDWGL